MPRLAALVALPAAAARCTISRATSPISERLLRRRHLGSAAGRGHGPAARSARAAARRRPSTSTTGKTGGKLAETLPFPVDRAVLERGQDRYRIFCTPCHGELGDGRGMIVRRGFNPPPTFHSDELRKEPVGHFFDVMTRGYGTMYSYASRVPPRDRWAIAAYIRALQLSQHAVAAELAGRRSRASSGGSRHEPHDGRAMMCDQSCGCGSTGCRSGALVVGGVGLALCLRGVGVLAESFFRAVPGRVSLLAGDRAGLDGPDDAASPGGRLVGTGDPAAARGGGGDGAAARRAIPADRLRNACSLSVGACRLRPAHLDDVTRGSPTSTNRCSWFAPPATSESGSALAFLLIGWSSRQDHIERPSAERPASSVERPGTVILFLGGHLFGDRLGDVARGPVGLDDLRRDGDHGRGDGDVRRDDRRSPLSWRRPGRCRRSRRPGRLNDLGNLLLAFVMLWAYMSFCQFLIVWSGNLTEEIPWYLRRTRGGWEWVALALIVCQFFLPFFLLLIRENKRRTRVASGRDALDPGDALDRPDLAGDPRHVRPGEPADSLDRDSPELHWRWPEWAGSGRLSSSGD